MPIIQVEHVTKEYRLGAMQSLKSIFSRMAGQEPSKSRSFKALDDVSFSIEPGEVVGIIGHNGAGKSTLLKLLSRIATSSSGRVVVNGRVAPLIEVGAGLVGDMTGRENILLNATILGMRRDEIAQKMNDIIAFAELEQFIDTPIKRYSSGMQVRLGFAIATAATSEILIVDEVLAVGDLAFQQKCMERMKSIIAESDRTVLIVGHNLRQLQRICTRVIMLDHGRISFDGDPVTACDLYFKESSERVHENLKSSSQQKLRIDKSGEIEVTSITLRDAQHASCDEFLMHAPLVVQVEFDCANDVEGIEIVVGIHTADMIYIASAGTGTLDRKFNPAKGRQSIACTFPDLGLYPGTYAIRLSFLDQYSRPMWYGENLTTFRVTAGSVSRGKMPTLGLIDMPNSWNFDGLIE